MITFTFSLFSKYHEEAILRCMRSETFPMLITNNVFTRYQLSRFLLQLKVTDEDDRKLKFVTNNYRADSQ